MATGIPYQPLIDLIPTKGLNEVSDPLRLSKTEARKLDNIDLDNNGIWRRRKGWGTLYNTTKSHSLCSDSFGVYFINNGNLVSPVFNSTYQVTGLTTLDTGWGTFPMDSVHINEQTFIANERKIGYLQGGLFYEFSIPDPAISPELSVMPAGSLLTYYNGRLFVATGGVIWYSNSLDYEHTELKNNFLMFPAEITLMKATSKGIWVSADRTYFLSGEDADILHPSVKDDTLAIKGTSNIINESDMGHATSYRLPDGMSVIWLTKQGVCNGREDGTFKNLSKQTLNVSQNTIEGASIVRYNQDGIEQYIVTAN